MNKKKPDIIKEFAKRGYHLKKVEGGYDLWGTGRVYSERAAYKVLANWSRGGAAREMAKRVQNRRVRYTPPNKELDNTKRDTWMWD